MPLAEAQSPLHAPDRGAEPPACPWLRRRAPCMPLADAQNLLHAPDRGAEPTACPWLRRRAPCMPLAEALSPCIPPGCIPLTCPCRHASTPRPGCIPLEAKGEAKPEVGLRCRPGCIPPAQAEALHKCSHPLTPSLSHPFTVSLSHTLTTSPPHGPRCAPLHALLIPPSMLSACPPPCPPQPFMMPSSCPS